MSIRPEQLTRPDQAEDYFLAWFLGLPRHADVTGAARDALARMDAAIPAAAGTPVSPATARLRELFRQAALIQPGPPQSRRRRPATTRRLQ